MPQKLQARKGALCIVSGVWGQYSVFGMSVSVYRPGQLAVDPLTALSPVVSQAL